jgi:hypothetical protein
MINKHENISVGVTGWKWSEWPKITDTNLKTAKSTVAVHSVWHDIYVTTETGESACCCLLFVRLRNSDRERATEIRRNAQT